ncbi:ShlB/FhaC/HecB family hemolysin secretion/activation protein [Glaciimonas sp. GG7]
MKPVQTPLKPLLAILLMAYFPLAAHAAGPVIPGAGDILQQIQPIMPPEPSSATTGLTIVPKAAATLPTSAPFMVKTIVITGNTVFDAATLHALIANAEGSNITLTELGQLAGRITDYYHSHGYPLAQAVIPAQQLSDGTVTIQVLEARYGNISLVNSSRVVFSLLEKTLASLQAGQEIDQARLDHALLLLSDIPGVVSGATLAPGETVGTSDLLVKAEAGPMVSGYAVIDNAGNRYTGRGRFGATLNINNPLHLGDVLSANVLTSGGAMNYGRLSYEALINGEGARIGGAYSGLHYSLGKSLGPLDAHGTAQVDSLWVKHPLIRTRDVNVYGQLQYDQLTLRDHIDATTILTDRHLENWNLALSGDVRDVLLGGAINSWSAGWTTGRVGFDNASAKLADAATTKSQGRFSKWNLSLSRLQNLTQSNSLFVSFSGQVANTNLDSAEKMSAGGMYTVRAYDMGALSGDTGYIGSVELRHALGALLDGQWQAIAFADSARLTINKNVWVADRFVLDEPGA